MAATTLDDVVKQLQANNDTSKKLADQFNAWFKAQQRAQLDALEEKRESKKSGSDPRAGKGSGGGLPPGLARLGLPALVALTASMAGFDNALKAMRLPAVFSSFTKTISGLGTKLTNFVDSIKNFKLRLPELPKIAFVDVDGKPYDFSKIGKLFQGPFDQMKLNFGMLRDDIDIRLTDITTRIGDVVDSMKTSILGTFDNIKASAISRLAPITESISGKISKIIDPITGFFDNTSGRANQVFADALAPITERVTSVKTAVQTFFDRIPRISFTMPEGVDSIVDKVKTAFGSMEDGTGILGFLGRVGTLFKPLLVPFEFLVKTVLRPITQVFLSLIDFFVGFYDGFTMEDGTFGDKLKSGIEGGILGVIKGFTDAIDMIFIDLPAWVMEKLGFEGIAENLREFSLTAIVDPIWEAVKSFFISAFSDPSGTFMAAAAGVGNMADDLIKLILRKTLPTPGGAWYDPRSLASAVIPSSVYEYAGMNPQTGEMLPTAAEITPVATATVAGALGEDPRGGQAATVVIQDNSNKGGNTQVSAPTNVNVAESPTDESGRWWNPFD